MLRRMSLVIGLVLTMMTASLVPSASADVSDLRASWRWDECRFKTLTDRPGEDDWTTREIALTIQCGVDHYPVYGGAAKALAVGSCESGLDEDEYGNPPYIGVYQFHPSTWSSAFANWRNFAQRWSIRSSPWNGRSNVLIAIKMVHSGGWGPWSCA